MPQRPKVLHVITSLLPGGAEKLMVDLLPRLARQGFDVELLTFDGTRTPFMEKLLARGIRVHHFGPGRSPYNPLCLAGMMPMMKDYDIVHTHNTPAQLFGAIASLAHRPLMVTTEHNTTNRRRGSALWRMADSRMYARYDRVICVSQLTERNLREHLGHDIDAVTITNGVPLDEYFGARPAQDIMRYGPKTVKLLQVSAFRQQKDQPTAIRAIGLLPANHHLFLAGDGECRAACETLSRELGVEERVHFLGARADVPGLLAAADAVVISTHYEGFCLAAVEAMAAGKPMVVSDVPVIQDVTGNAALLFPDADADALAAQIRRLTPHMCGELSQKALARATQFDISAMAQAYAAQYRSLLNRN